MLSIEWYINTNLPYSYRRSDPLKPGRSSGKSLGIFSFPLHFPTIFISLSIVDVALNRASLFMSGVLERIKTNSNTTVRTILNQHCCLHTLAVARIGFVLWSYPRDRTDTLVRILVVRNNGRPTRRDKEKDDRSSSSIEFTIRTIFS